MKKLVLFILPILVTSCSVGPTKGIGIDFLCKIPGIKNIKEVCPSAEDCQLPLYADSPQCQRYQKGEAEQRQFVLAEPAEEKALEPIVEPVEEPLPSLSPLDLSDPYSIVEWTVYAIATKDTSVFKELIGKTGTVYAPYATGFQPPGYDNDDEVIEEIDKALARSEPTCRGYQFRYFQEGGNPDRVFMFFENMEFDESFTGYPLGAEVYNFGYFLEGDHYELLFIGEVPPMGLEGEYKDLTPCLGNLQSGEDIEPGGEYGTKPDFGHIRILEPQEGETVIVWDCGTQTCGWPWFLDWEPYPASNFQITVLTGETVFEQFTVSGTGTVGQMSGIPGEEGEFWYSCGYNGPVTVKIVALDNNEVLAEGELHFWGIDARANFGNCPGR